MLTPTMAALEDLVDTARENADAEILRYNAILDKQEALLRIRRSSESFVSSWVPRKKSPLPRRLIKLQRATLPPPCRVVFERALNTPFLGHSHTTSPVAVLMALFVLPATVLGISPEIVELKRAFDV